MDTIHFYQPPKAGLRSDGRPTASNFRISRANGEGDQSSAFEPSKGNSGNLEDHDLIEFLDMTALPQEEFLSPLREPVSDLSGNKPDVADILSESYTIRGHGRNDNEDDNNLPTLEELLLGAIQAQKPERTGSIDEHVTGRVERDIEHVVGSDCNEVISHRARRGESKEAPIILEDDHSEDDHSQDTEQEEEGDKFYKDSEPDPSATEDKQDQRDDKVADTDNEREEADGDCDKNNLPLRSTKKRSLFAVGETPYVKRRVKRRRFSLPLSSAKDTERADESDTSNYTPRQTQYSSYLRPTPSHPTRLEGDISDNGTMESADPQHWMAVIYEQQKWEGEIIEEKSVK
ncbi:MAG: hypothetical protein Q9217_006536 [Psora testacea]